MTELTRLSSIIDEGGVMSTDVLVIGGGPAGLTAAIYLGRFHLDVILVDRGGSRASLIPKTRNHAGFPDGISGPDLIARMREQAVKFGAHLIVGEVTKIERNAERFVALAGARTIRSRAVLMATGVSNNRPTMEETVHDAALAQGLLRYCPVCDGYEVTDRRVAVIGTGERGMKETMFLRSYTADLTMIAPDGAHELNAAQRRALTNAGVLLLDGPCSDISIDGDQIAIVASAGRTLYDSVYPALGSRIHSEMAKQLGANMSEDGCLVVDEHQRTDVPGLYAAGDVVFGLDQISHAMGEGGVAATTIRNDLADHSPQWRGPVVSRSTDHAGISVVG